MRTSQPLRALESANAAQRCAHIHLSGRRCGSPAHAGRRLCYFHDRARRPARPNYDLPLLEDATAVQFALTQVVRALQDKALDTKTCALLLYALQTASANLKRLAEEHDAQGREAQAAAAEPDPSLAEILFRELGLDEASLADDREPAADGDSPTTDDRGPTASSPDDRKPQAADPAAGEKGDPGAAREVLRGPEGRSA